MPWRDVVVAASNQRTFSETSFEYTEAKRANYLDSTLYAGYMRFLEHSHVGEYLIIIDHATQDCGIITGATGGIKVVFVSPSIHRSDRAV